MVVEGYGGGERLRLRWKAAVAVEGCGSDGELQWRWNDSVAVAVLLSGTHFVFFDRLDRFELCIMVNRLCWCDGEGDGAGVETSGQLVVTRRVGGIDLYHRGVERRVAGGFESQIVEVEELIVALAVDADANSCETRRGSASA